MKKLTENLIQQRLKTCTTDLEKVQQINVTGRELKDVSLLRKMTGVEVLSLSVNQISSLVDFQCCKNLRELYLRHNKITKLNEIFYLKDLPKLELLMLSQNPCAEDPLYRMTVIRNLKNLKELDGVTITQEERKHAQKEGREVTGSNTSIDPRENSIPSGPQIKKSTQSVQRPKPLEKSEIDLSDTKTYKIKKKSNVKETAREGVKDSAKVSSVCEKASKPENQQSPKFKSKPVSLMPPKQNEKVHAALCRVCGNTPQEYFRIDPQNSNILSATLSLIKELDYASLQIVNAEVNSLLSAFEVNFICQRHPFIPRNGTINNTMEV